MDQGYELAKLCVQKLMDTPGTQEIVDKAQEIIKNHDPLIAVDYGDPQTQMHRSIPCDACYGKGDADCRKCEGTGRIFYAVQPPKDSLLVLCVVVACVFAVLVVTAAWW
jgi:hypothetical protein